MMTGTVSDSKYNYPMVRTQNEEVVKPRGRDIDNHDQGLSFECKKGAQLIGMPKYTPNANNSFLVNTKSERLLIGFYTAIFICYWTSIFVKTNSLKMFSKHTKYNRKQCFIRIYVARSQNEDLMSK